MEALKTSFLPNLSIESTVVSNGHFCSLCGEQFEGSQQAIEHMHLCHGGLSSVTGISGGNIIISSHNVNSNTVKIDYSCHSCDEKFSSIHELEEHLRLVHQNSSVLIRCPACNFFGMSASSLQEPNEYKCGNCGSECSTTNLTASEARFHSRTSDSTRTSLSGHNMKMRSQTVHQYEQETISHNRQQQQTQQQRRKDHERNGILKVPPLTVKLNKNINSNSVMHSHVTIKQEPSNGDGADTPSIYSIQQTPYPVNDVVISTTQTHVSSNMDTTILAAGATVNKVRHKCPNCSKTFKTLGTLAMHRKIHTGEADTTPKQRPFQCTYCGKSFTQSNSLKLHTRIHTGEKPFSCGYCGRAFKVKDYLNKHLTTHTGEKPFQCSYCEKAFSVKDYLTKHIRTHTGEKPYICSYCEKRFTQRSALTVHITKLHPL